VAQEETSAVSREEEREHLQRLIELHRANLRHYEELEARYGLDCPAYVKHAKEEARKGLAEARARLAALEGDAPDTRLSIPAIPQNLPSRGEFNGRGGRFRVIRVAPGFRVRGGVQRTRRIERTDLAKVR
jgi:hypothetical protein